MMIKKLLLASFITVSLAAVSTVTLAEEAKAAPEVAASPAQSGSAAEVVKHLELALVEVDIKKSDFTAATRHLKAAREVAVAIGGHADGIQSIQDAKKQVGLGDNAKATEYLNNALEIYKAIN